MNETGLKHARRHYARLMAACASSDDSRLERVFEQVAREDFLGPGPWKIMIGHHYVETPNDDPIHIYQNVLVALDANANINNGEPFLHAAWIASVAPQKGEIVTHIGAGTGYYSAILSQLVLPGGRVNAYEINEVLASAAQRNLEPFKNVKVFAADAVSSKIPACDIIYINAGISSLPVQWLEALNLHGRIIFPWSPGLNGGPTIVMKKAAGGFHIKALAQVWFIPCIGASEKQTSARLVQNGSLQSVRSAYFISERQPDDTALAIFDELWFSSAVLVE
ncbi:MAG: SAM-dependent methyltransferase [Rhizobiaceae bacterium]|nr:SAM-dependent methyltransferase [Rhizobiaceae bacterium]